MVTQTTYRGPNCSRFLAWMLGIGLLLLPAPLTLTLAGPDEPVTQVSHKPRSALAAPESPPADSPSPTVTATRPMSISRALKRSRM